MPSPYEGVDSAAVQQNLVVLSQHNAIIRAVDETAKFLNMLKVGAKPTNTYHEWDVMPAFTPTSGATSEGQDKTSGWGSVRPKKLRNHLDARVSKGWHVTRTAAELKQKDVSSEIAEQRLNDSMLHALDWECTLMSSQDADDATVSGMRRTRGAFDWLKPVAGTSLYKANTTYSQRAIDPIDASVAVSPAQFYDGAAASFTETVWKDIMRACYQQRRTAVDLQMLCGIRLKQAMSAFALTQVVSANVPSRVVQVAQDAEKLNDVVDWFRCDAGQQINRLHNFVNQAITDGVWTPADGSLSDYSGIAIDPAMWRIAWLRPIRHTAIEDKGAGMRGFHDSEGILIALSVQGQYAVAPSS